MWVSFDEAQDILTSGAVLDPESMLPQQASGDGLGGLCPEGHGILSRARVDTGDGPFHLERCAECSGLWFDAGEWHKIASSHLINHLGSIWDPEWQRARRRAQSQARHTEKMKTELGEALLIKLDELATQLARNPKRGEAIAYLMERIQSPED